jgi:hypothetical protein
MRSPAYHGTGPSGSSRAVPTGPSGAAAQLIRSGIPVVSQRDFRTLGVIFRRLGRSDLAPPSAIDHHESEWYREYFRRS